MIRTTLPECDYSLLIRADFSDDAAWEQLCGAIREPQTGHRLRAAVECISDNACSGLTPMTVASVLPAGSQRPFVFVADSRTFSQADRPVLVVDLLEQPGRAFRVVPCHAWGVENNLRLANMDFSDFADSVDADGVFRGFPGAPV